MQISESIKNKNFKNCLENLPIKGQHKKYELKNDSMSFSAKISTVVLYLYLSNVVNWVDRNNL